MYRACGFFGHTIDTEVVGASKYRHLKWDGTATCVGLSIKDTNYTCGYDETTQQPIADGVETTLNGCAGNLKIMAGEVGAPVTTEFTFKGSTKGVVKVTDELPKTYVGIDKTDCETFVGGVAVLYDSSTQDLTSFELDLGNELSMKESFLSDTGVLWGAVTNAKATLKCTMLEEDTLIYEKVRSNEDTTVSVTLESIAFVVTCAKPRSIERTVVNGYKAISVTWGIKEILRKQILAQV